MRPRLTGCNIALWRDDYERVNGFDENFVGWGLEDRDLQVRLGRLGLRFRSIVLATAPCHLWHRPHPTFARNNEGTANLSLLPAEEVPSPLPEWTGQRRRRRPARRAATPGARGISPVRTSR